MKDDISLDNASPLIKEHFFDGSIEVLCFGISDNSILEKMIIDTIIVNPKIIMCSPTNESFLKNRYDMIDSKTGVFMRKDLRTEDQQ